MHVRFCFYIGILQVLFLQIIMTNSSSFTAEIAVFGLLAPTAAPALAYHGPAFDAAIEKQRTVYPNVTFVRTLVSDQSVGTCEQLADNTEYILSRWYYGKSRPRSNVTVIVSPVCLEGVPLNRMAAAWNVLLISTSSATDTSHDHTPSPTWVSVAYWSFNVCAAFYMNLLEKYKWTNVYVIIDESSVLIYSVIGPAVIKAFKHAYGKQPPVRRLALRNASSTLYIETLRDFSTSSRVLLFFGNAAGFRRLMIAAHSLDMTNGEYVFVTFELFPHKNYGNLTPIYGDEFDQIASEAFQSVLVAQSENQTYLGSPTARDLALEFVARSKRDYNFMYPLADQTPAAMSSSFAGVTLFGHVMDEILRNDITFDFTDGTRLAERFANREFHSDDVGYIYIDSNKERHINLAFSHFDSTGQRSNFLIQPADSEPLIQTAEMTGWAGRADNYWPPPNEPPCGYLGKRLACLQRKGGHRIVVGVAVSGALLVSLGIGVIIYLRTNKWERLDPLWWSITLSWDQRFFYV